MTTIKHHLRKRLSEPASRRLRFAHDHSIKLSEGDSKVLTGVHLARLGDYTHPVFGDFSISETTTRELIANFEAGVFGQRIFVDVAHKPENGAAAEITRVYMDGEWLKGDLELTEYGTDAIKNKKFIYLSVDYADAWQDSRSKALHGATLFGAGLTTRPFIKGQPGIMLAETTETEREPMNWLEKLQAELKALGASLELSKSLSDAFDVKLKTLNNDPARKQLMDSFIAAGESAIKQLADQPAGTPITITLDAGSPGMDMAAVEKLLNDREASRTLAAEEGAKKLTDNKASFSKLLDDAEGLSVETKKQLSEAADLITGEMTTAQIKQLADFQIKQGQAQEAQRQLSGMGFNVAGSPRITVGADQSIDKLQAEVDKRLGLDTLPAARRYAGGSLSSENKTLAEKALALYDHNHRAQLMAEAKQLGDATNVMSNVSVPASFERTVLREALYQIIGTQFVDAGTAAFGESHSFHYSYRNMAGAGINDTTHYEGQGIPRAGVIQTSAAAYPIPQKLSFEVSDELRYLTGASELAWEAVSENQQNATRIIAEDTDRKLFNEQVHSADEFQCIPVTSEDLAAVIAAGPAGSRVAVIGGVNPAAIVRPRSEFTLQGQLIGNTANPIVVNYDGAAIAQFDPLAVDDAGVTTLAAGHYYVLDYDIGEIYIVNESGVIQNPAGKAWTISYSRATNLAFFDTDVPTGTTEGKHWDKFLKLYELRKSVIEDHRYYMTNFGLMSGSAMTEVGTADKFESSHRIPATELSANGNLGRVKDVPNFKTRAPGLWMGDRRVMIGESRNTKFRICKPWTMGQLENQRDASGKFTGMKEAYGDQFMYLYTPKQLKGALTSIVMYSASARVTRVSP